MTNKQCKNIASIWAAGSLRSFGFDSFVSGKISRQDEDKILMYVQKFSDKIQGKLPKIYDLNEIIDFVKQTQ